MRSAPGRLVAGSNVLAAEVPPAATSPLVVPDLTFDLELGSNVPALPDQPPAVVTTNVCNGNLFEAGTAIPIVADVVDPPDGDLTEVRIFADGALLATRFAPPFSATSPAAGIHRISVEALDQSGRLSRTEAVFTTAIRFPSSRPAALCISR